ncbi:MAG: CvpA family protein [Lachnospiraceae bacterium]|nr:CvpA family protein [Lachnospiraceae bacterium]
MNWLLIALIVFVIVEIVLSYRRGFAKMLLSLCSTVVAIIAVIILAPIVKDIVLKNTQWEPQLAERIGSAIEKKLSDGSNLPEVLQNLPLPESVKETIGAGMSGGSAAEAVMKLSHKVANIAITAGVYVATFIVVLLLLKLLSGVLGLVTKIPGLQQLNGLLGVALGLVECVIIVDTAFLVIMAISNTPLGQTLTGMIQDSPVLTFIYEHNLLSLIWAQIFAAGKEAALPSLLHLQG